jgi:hypothetical protein
MPPSSKFLSLTLLLSATPLLAQAGYGPTAPQKDQLIKEAMAAGPAHIAKDATILAPGPDGQMVELRHGTNGWTCIPDSPESPGKDPMCADEQAMQWAGSWMAHDDHPANTAPGLAYMLAGGSDISANDPWAKADKDTKLTVVMP